ncbi:efflux RND transporter periplasmic adaptor subunit [Roseomonas sp. OT10]|uniref:efflux RND transporter periplasmic adaptor subunit n=1 Tax=Roseomonas cutis TaxID=2897332 RepID=UPI001E56D155|nr:efflux RND transporter periplasmic adaptor subunit [Roseomonas sp. OT10]UFN48766.1 efflux RND transporter periplasmic adaptor subunit [Roseomonas sp. OT10]
MPPSIAPLRPLLSGAEPRHSVLRRSAVRLAAAALALLLPAAPHAQERPASPPVAVSAAPATVGPMPVEVTTNGNAEAPSVISVRARVDGQVQQVHVQEGQVVRKGQLLFTLDSRTAQALLEQQQANLQRDRALLARAQSDAQRYASLRSDAFASAQRAEQAQADALSQAAIVKAGEAAVEQTRLAVDYATIRAEADGRLGALPVKAGNFVRASEGAVLATITQTDPILVTFAVPERWLGELRAAQGRGETPAVLAHAPDDALPPAQGELVFIDSAVDTATGTIRLKGRIANPDSRFWPGQYLEVTLVPRTEPQALSVPVAAVQTGQQGRFLYAVRPEAAGQGAAPAPGGAASGAPPGEAGRRTGTARRVPVQVVRYAAGRAVVQGELADGELVVTEGAQRLQDGARVALRTEPAARPGRGSPPGEGPQAQAAAR